MVFVERYNFKEKSGKTRGFEEGFSYLIEKTFQINEIHDINLSEFRKRLKNKRGKEKYSLKTILNGVKNKIVVGNQLTASKLNFNDGNVFVILIDGTTCNQRGFMRTTLGSTHQLLKKSWKYNSLEKERLLYFCGPANGPILDLPLKGIEIFRGDQVESVLFNAYKKFVNCSQNINDPILYLFGESRGGFAALSLSNIIRRCGVPTIDIENQIEKNISFYKNCDKKNKNEKLVYKGKKEVRMKFIGLFDCVSSVFCGNEYHDISLIGVEKMYHAVSLNETCPLFLPTLPTDAIPGLHITEWLLGGHLDFGSLLFLKFEKQNILNNIILCSMLEKTIDAGLYFNYHSIEKMIKKCKDIDRVRKVKPKPVTKILKVLEKVVPKIPQEYVKKMKILLAKRICRRSCFLTKDVFSSVHESVYYLANKLLDEDLKVIQFIDKFNSPNFGSYMKKKSIENFVLENKDLSKIEFVLKERLPKTQKEEKIESVDIILEIFEIKDNKAIQIEKVIKKVDKLISFSNLNLELKKKIDNKNEISIDIKTTKKKKKKNEFVKVF